MSKSLTHNSSVLLRRSAYAPAYAKSNLIYWETELRCVYPKESFNEKRFKKQIQQLEQKMAKSPNNMNNSGSHFLYHREQMIRFKLMQAGISQKKLAKHLNLTESYISKLITGERYNQYFEIFLRKILKLDYCFI